LSTAVPSGVYPRRLIVAALGTTEILAWGSSYYLLAVLAKPISADTGWPLSIVVGGLSLGLIAGSMASPKIGRLIEAHGGRPVLAASSVLLGIGLALLGSVPHLALYAAAWMVIGVGMGAGLYDAAFATLGRAYGAEARRAIVTVTLWGGFASTVCWPLSAYLLDAVGWRGVCFVYAGLHLGFALPLHLALMPRVASAPAGSQIARQPQAVLTAPQRRAFGLFAVLIVLGGAVASIMSVHLLALLQARGLDLAAAVALGTLVGPSQVGSRVGEMAFGNRYHAIWTLAAAKTLMGLGVILLLAAIPLAGLAIVIYGAGNGLWSIARGTMPLALFGAAGYATRVGRLARYGLFAQALSPAAAAMLLDRFGPGAVLLLLTAFVLVNIGVTAALWRHVAQTRLSPGAV
jgi:MFS family permease